MALISSTFCAALTNSRISKVCTFCIAYPVGIDPIQIRVDRENTLVTSFRMRFVKMSELGPLNDAEIESYISQVLTEHEPSEVESIKPASNPRSMLTAAARPESLMSCFTEEVFRATHSGAHEPLMYPISVLCVCSSADKDPADLLKAMYKDKKPAYPWGVHMDASVIQSYMVVHDDTTEIDTESLMRKVRTLCGPSQCTMVKLDAAPSSPEVQRVMEAAVKRYRAVSYRDPAEYAAALSRACNLQSLPSLGSLSNVKVANRQSIIQNIVRSICNLIALLHNSISSLQPMKKAFKSISRQLRAAAKSDGAASIPTGSGRHGMPPIEYARKLLADLYLSIGQTEAAKEQYGILSRVRRVRGESPSTAAIGAVERLAWLAFADSPASAAPLFGEAAELYACVAHSDEIISVSPAMLRCRSLLAQTLCLITDANGATEAANAASAASSPPHPHLKTPPSVAAPLLELGGLCHLAAPVPRTRKHVLHMYMAAHRYGLCGSAPHAYRALLSVTRPDDAWDTLTLALLWNLWKHAEALELPGAVATHVQALAHLGVGSDAQQGKSLRGLSDIVESSGECPSLGLVDKVAHVVAPDQHCAPAPAPPIVMSQQHWNTFIKYEREWPKMVEMLIPERGKITDPRVAHPNETATLHFVWTNKYKLIFDIKDVVVFIEVESDSSTADSPETETLEVECDWIGAKGKTSFKIIPESTKRCELAFTIAPEWSGKTITVTGLRFQETHLELTLTESFALPRVTLPARGDATPVTLPNPQLSLAVGAPAPFIGLKIDHFRPMSTGAVQDYATSDPSHRVAYSGMLVAGQLSITNSGTAPAPARLVCTHRSCLVIPALPDSTLDPHTAPYPQLAADSDLGTRRDVLEHHPGDAPPHLMESTVGLSDVAPGETITVEFIFIVPPVEVTTTLTVGFGVECGGRATCIDFPINVYRSVASEMLLAATPTGIKVHCELVNRIPIQLTGAGLVIRSGLWRPTSTVDPIDILSGQSAVAAIDLTLDESRLMQTQTILDVDPQYMLTEAVVSTLLHQARLDQHRETMRSIYQATRDAVQIVSEHPPAYIDSKEKSERELTPLELHLVHHATVVARREASTVDAGLLWSAASVGVSFIGITPLLDIVPAAFETGTLPAETEALVPAGWVAGRHVLTELVPLVVNVTVSSASGPTNVYPRLIPVFIKIQNICPLPTSAAIRVDQPDIPTELASTAVSVAGIDPIAPLLFAGTTAIELTNIPAGECRTVEVHAIAPGPGEHDLTESITVSATVEYTRLDSEVPERPPTPSSGLTRVPNSLASLPTSGVATPRMEIGSGHPLVSCGGGGKGFFQCDMQGRRTVEIAPAVRSFEGLRLCGTTRLVVNG